MGILWPHKTYLVSRPTYLSFLLASLLNLSGKLRHLFILCLTLTITFSRFLRATLAESLSHSLRSLPSCHFLLQKKKHLLPINSYLILCSSTIEPSIRISGIPLAYNGVCWLYFAAPLGCNYFLPLSGSTCP